MKAIAVNNGIVTKYFSAESKALAFLASRSADKKVYDKFGNVVNDLYVKGSGEQRYYTKNDTTNDISVLFPNMNLAPIEESKEWIVINITID